MAYMKALGYGLPWHRFEELYLGDCEAHKTHEHVLSVFETATDEMLTVDDTFYEHCFYGEGIPSISEKRVLSKTYTEGGRRSADIGSATELMTTVWGPDDDDPRLILFFPTLRFARSWQRRNDTIDLAFDRWKDGFRRDDRYEPTELIAELPYGHDPFTHHLMLEDGTPQRWRHFTELAERPDIVPAPPSEMHFYLPRLNILDAAGVNELRPYIAQWWT